jgi:hypothetical protein
MILLRNICFIELMKLCLSLELTTAKAIAAVRTDIPWFGSQYRCYINRGNVKVLTVLELHKPTSYEHD